MNLRVGLKEIFIDERSLESLLSNKFSKPVKLIRYEKLGEGFHAVAYRVKLDVDGIEKSVVLRVMRGDTGWGHDYVSDRAASLLLQHNLYRSSPIRSPVSSIDVLCLLSDGRVESIGDAVEFIHLMDEVTEEYGRPYVYDLFEIASRGTLTDRDIGRCRMLVSYLYMLHSVKIFNRNLYLRHIRDLVGHGEMFMGVVDSYPDLSSLGWIDEDRVLKLEKKMVEWRYKLRRYTYRASRIHGDFHPFGNIRFRSDDQPVILEYSREEYGEPADDLSALTINYLFISIWKCGSYAQPFRTLFEEFFETYMRETGDTEILRVIQPFYCFRGLVVIHPLYYPEMEYWKRLSILRFIENVSSIEEFDPKKVSDYLGEIEGSSSV
ncbi:MAG: aminoglycoside phosphotransferase family protein [Candidatus Bathyarchaeota archaeon]|nr:aminoglycoside phosphotransferase family protein [Candidatus Bathyarchaeota archaeon]